ncbi:hypothetical protein Tco_1430251 [Tanacetum coccineum]
MSTGLVSLLGKLVDQAVEDLWTVHNLYEPSSGLVQGILQNCCFKIILFASSWIVISIKNLDLNGIPLSFASVHLMELSKMDLCLMVETVEGVCWVGVCDDGGGGGSGGGISSCDADMFSFEGRRFIMDLIMFFLFRVSSALIPLV